MKREKDSKRVRRHRTNRFNSADHLSRQRSLSMFDGPREGVLQFLWHETQHLSPASSSFQIVLGLPAELSHGQDLSMQVCYSPSSGTRSAEVDSQCACTLESSHSSCPLIAIVSFRSVHMPIPPILFPWRIAATASRLGLR
jgi:hypothetical protein